MDALMLDLELEEERGRLRRRAPRPAVRPPLRRPPRALLRPRVRVAGAPAPCVCPAHGTEFVRWVQSALNDVLALRLPVNGVMDAAARGALRKFQARERLPADGIAGPETERALVEARAKRGEGELHEELRTDVIKPAAVRLEGFGFDRAELAPAHRAAIDAFAAKVAASWHAGAPIVTVRVVGHADPEGSARHNQALGLRRALAARKELMRALEKKQRHLSHKVLILASSKGESEPLDVGQTAQGQARNRRVEIFSSTKALQPIRTPAKRSAPQPTFRGKVPVVVPDLGTPRLPVGDEGCRAAEFDKLRADCNQQYAKEAVTAWAIGYLKALLATTKAAPCLRMLPNIPAVALCAAPKVGPEIAEKVMAVYRRFRSANADRLKCIEAASKFTHCPK